MVLFGCGLCVGFICGLVFYRILWRAARHRHHSALQVYQNVVALLEARRLEKEKERLFWEEAIEIVKLHLTPAEVEKFEKLVERTFFRPNCHNCTKGGATCSVDKGGPTDE